MTVILGGDGLVALTLPTGDPETPGTLKAVAEVFSWSASLGRETLRTTRQDDESERRTAGRSDHTGSISLRINLLEDDAECLSLLQLLELTTTATDDDLKATITLWVTRGGSGDVCDSSLDDAVSLQGSVVITDIRIDCSEPDAPVVAVMSWESNGGLSVVKEPALA